MTTERDLVRLMAWLSPAFPTGAFAYSHGLETAIRDGRVTSAEALCGWLSGLLEHGAPWTDAVLFKAAWAAADDEGALAEISDLALALAPSMERLRETTAQGEAFLAAVAAWPSPLLPSPAAAGEGTLTPAPNSAAVVQAPNPLPQRGKGEERACAYPVAVGATCAAHGIPLEPALAAYLHAVAANLVSVAVRLVPLGQRAGVSVIAGLEDAVLATARRAAASGLDDLGSAAFVSDIAAMRHETLPTRIFAT